MAEKIVHSRRSKVENAVYAALVLVVILRSPAMAQPVPAAPPPGTMTPHAERTVLYWYDPMHPKYHSDKPGPAPDCGMEMVPMYTDAGAGTGSLPPGAVEISPYKQQLSGIRTATVSRRSLTKVIHAVGIVQPDETRVRKVHIKFPGWVNKLFVNFTGQAVRANEPILAIYSPDLVSTQAEYLLAWRGEQQLQASPFAQAATNSQTLLDAARRRLLLWDITPQQIRALQEIGTPETSVTLHAPTSGYVTAKDVYEGLYVTPEMTLYTVTDLARVWVLLDLYEPELPFVRLGTPVTLTLRSYPGETRRGTVSYIYPYLENQTRTNKVRVELDNSDFRLKPEMYANGEIRALLDEHVVVPQDAVLDSGAQQVVFVVAADGHFEPRTVRLGQRADNDVEVLDGLNDGERVVVAANFLVDSESQLKAALDAMGGSDQAPPH